MQLYLSDLDVSKSSQFRKQSKLTNKPSPSTIVSTSTLHSSTPLLNTPSTNKQSTNRTPTRNTQSSSHRTSSTSTPKHQQTTANSKCHRFHFRRLSMKRQDMIIRIHISAFLSSEIIQARCILDYIGFYFFL